MLETFCTDGRLLTSSLLDFINFLNDEEKAIVNTFLENL